MLTSPFFSSLYFAIPALVLVGSSWCLTGFVMGNCPKHKVPSAVVQQMGAILSILISLLIMLGTRSWFECSWSIFLVVSLVYMLGCFINFFMLQLMSKAMQRGPNGVIWAIIQSAMIFPFMGGIVFFGNESNWVQWLGVGSIVCALFIFGALKDNSVKYEKKPGELGWKTLAFCAFACVAVQQNLTTAPSYFPQAESIPSILRTVASSLGTLLGFVAYSLFQKGGQTQEQETSVRQCFKMPIFWKYILAMQAFGLVSSYLLFYPSIDIMARNNLGGSAYPMMVGSCIVAFTLMAALQLKERIRLMQLIGLLLCIAGLVGICWK